MKKIFSLKKEVERYKKSKNLFFKSFIFIVIISIIGILFFIYNILLAEKNNNTIYVTKYPKIYLYIIGGCIITLFFFGKELLAKSLELKNLKKTFTNPELYLYYLMKYGNSTIIFSGRYTGVNMTKSTGTNGKMGSLFQSYPSNIYQIVKENYLKNINKSLRKANTKEEKERVVYEVATRFKGSNLLYKSYLQMESIQEGNTQNYINYFEYIWYNDYKNFHNFSPKIKKFLQKESKSQLLKDWDIRKAADTYHILHTLLRKLIPKNLQILILYMRWKN